MAGDALGAVVVGTSFGVLTHLRALRAAGFEVRALVGRDRAKAVERARRSRVPLGTTSLAEALALPGVDAVAVATPPHTHASITLEAIAAGKHVLCEKPFARDVAEARRMLDAAKAAGVVHLMGTEFRFATGQALATRAIREGVVGEPRLATFVFILPGLADPSGEVPEWWSDASQGGGWLGAYASHVIDQVRVTLGEFEGVSASLPLLSDRPDWSAEDSYSIHFRTRSGVHGVLQSSMGAWGPPFVCQHVAGSRGTLVIRGDEVFLSDRSGERRLEVPDDLRHPPPVPPPSDLLVTTYDHFHSGGTDLAPYTRLYEVMRDRIRGLPVPDDPVAASFEDGLEVQRVMDAARRSAAEKRWVSLDGPKP